MVTTRLLGQNITFAVRSAERNSQRLAALANELVGLKVDVILAINTPSVQAAKKASATVPIVMMRTADPVKSALVRSLSKPGGNVTGLTSMVDELSGKRLALLKEAFPGVPDTVVCRVTESSQQPKFAEFHSEGNGVCRHSLSIFSMFWAEHMGTGTQAPNWRSETWRFEWHHRVRIAAIIASVKRSGLT
jgi:ABC transporter substrate binding protein